MAAEMNELGEDALQYRRALQDILDRGVWTPTRQGVRALTALQVVMRFNLDRGFPVITERDIGRFWRKPIAEICAFINGATTVDQLQEFGCDWWEAWTTPDKTQSKGLPPGDIGPGSYGAAFKAFPMPDGRVFDQFSNLVEQLRSHPGDRTHFVSPWIPYYQYRGAGLGRKTTVSPCHGWVHVRVLGGQLHLHLYQRSGDFPIGVPSNMVQYAALTLMLASLTGHAPGWFYHTVSDAHIYEDQLPAVREMLAREPLGLPMVTLNAVGDNVGSISEFRAEHFDLHNYRAHPALRVPVAV